MRKPTAHFGYTALTAIAMATASFCIALPARADSEADKRLAADTIMTEATELMAKKDFASACPKLEDVVKLQPYGVGAKMTLADCYVGLGKFASAYAMYGAASSQAAQANQPDRASSAQDKAKSLEPRLSKLTIQVPADVAKTPGLVVESNGSPVLGSLFGLSKPVDGGHYVIRATAPGKAPFEKSIDVANEGVAVSVTVLLIDAPAAPPNAAPAGPTDVDPIDPGASNPASIKGDAAPSSGLGGVRIGGIVVGSLGLVLAGVGVGVGVTGLGASDDAAAAFTKAKAAGDKTGESTAIADNDSAKSQITAGWSLAGVGGAAIVAGIVMIALPHKTDASGATTAPSTSFYVSPWLNPKGPAGATFGGTF